MLTITLSATDDESAVELNLEHSLVSLSKWEELYEKPFFGKESKTEEETATYISLMVLGSPPPRNFINRIAPEDFSVITDYINAKRSATWFREEPGRRGMSEVITSELIYYWLISFGIPFDPCETWHLNRLMTLIKICGIKQTKPKKMSQQEVMNQNRALNEQRRREMGSSG